MKKIIGIISLLSLPLAAKAASINLNFNPGLGTQDLVETITNIIQIILGFLGVIAIIIVLVAGFQWMTAAGNEEKVSQAKKMLGAGVIGLIIILAAYAITTFIIGALGNAVG